MRVLKVTRLFAVLAIFALSAAKNCADFVKNFPKFECCSKSDQLGRKNSIAVFEIEKETQKYILTAEKGENAASKNRFLRKTGDFSLLETKIVDGFWLRIFGPKSVNPKNLSSAFDKFRQNFSGKKIRYAKNKKVGHVSARILAEGEDQMSGREADAAKSPAPGAGEEPVVLKDGKDVTYRGIFHENFTLIVILLSLVLLFLVGLLLRAALQERKEEEARARAPTDYPHQEAADDSIDL